MAGGSDLAERRSRLSPAKRALLEKRLLRSGDPAVSSGVIRRRPDPDLVPLSFAQERLWFLDQLEPGNPAYNRPVAFRLRGPLEVSVLERSLSEIVRRHQVLRARFYDVGGRAVQTIGPTEPVRLAVVDLRKYGVGERDARARQLAREEARRPFDVREGPLVRGTLLQLGGEEHVLVLVIHHIAFDGWSVRVLKGELDKLYEGYASGSPSPLPELSIQYADFAHWQREYVRGEVLETQLAYWKEKLAGCAPLYLPTDRPRPAVLGHEGAHQVGTIDPGLVWSLRRLSEEEGVTLYMTLLAAFKVLLHRYTGQHDIVVGSPLAGRTQVETEALIGFFVNTLVLRTDVSGDPSFREVLRRVRETALGAYGHQDVPFEKLVAELRPERDASRTPLFQVMFNLENLPGEEASGKGPGLEEFEFDSGVSQFDLHLELKEHDSGLSCCLGYRIDLFESATAVRMLGHYETLLESIIADPDQRVSRLPLLTDGERREVLVGWNDTAANYPQHLCLHQLFEAQAERTPDKTALVYEDRRLTYRELNERANQLAHCLRQRGAGTEVLVGLCMERSLEPVIAILGILKAGAAWVPLDPTHPRARLESVIRDSGLELVVSQPGLVELICSAGAVRCVPLDVDGPAPEIACQPSGNVHVEGLSPDNLAYVIYTSGSTGRPKGVAVPHRGVVNYLWYRVYELLGEGEPRAMIAHYAFSFDASVGQVFEALLVGGRVGIAKDAAEVGGLLSLHGATYLTSTPSMLDALMAETAIPDSVVTIGVGGEPLSEQLVQRVREATQARRMINAYGPTEATIACTIGVLFDRRLGEQSSGSAVPAEPYEGPVTVGRPIANVRAYILDANLQPVPVGVAGELHVGGIGLARGYVNQPDLTAEKFIPDPFGTERGSRMYKTGDLVRYLPDGRIVFMGRRDHQVKLRGFRVEVGSIETALAAHEAVEQAVVVAWGREGGGSSTPDVDWHLVAYIVPAKRPAPSVTELRRYLSEKLPHYMVPSRYVVLTAAPLTAAGKMDRQALPPPDQTRPDLNADFVPPQTRLESAIARVWRETLGVDQVGVYDNFFDLGGHSLLAMEVVARLEEALGLRFHPRDLMRQTLGQLAASCEEGPPSPKPAMREGFFRKVRRTLKAVVSRENVMRASGG